MQTAAFYNFVQFQGGIKLGYITHDGDTAHARHNNSLISDWQNGLVNRLPLAVLRQRTAEFKDIAESSL